MILVTGGTGTIGSELVRLLAERGAEFRAMVRGPDRARRLEAMGIATVPGDFTDAQSIDGALKGCTKLFLLTPTVEHQAALQRQAIQAAQQAGVGYLIKISALGASATSPVMLGREHAEAEKATKESGITYTILRPHSFMQNLLGMAQVIAGKGEFYGAAGAGKMAIVDARDVAAVAAALLTGDATAHGGATYEITGPEAISFSDAAAILSKVLGKAVRYVDLAGDALQGGLRQMGLPEWLAEDLVTLHTIYKAGHGAHVSDAVARITGKAARDFRTFTRDHARAFDGAA